MAHRPHRRRSGAVNVIHRRTRLIEALIFLHRYLRFDQRDDLREILAALDRFGRKPSITRLG